MAKKRRSAKQRANDKRLGQMAKRRGRSSTTKPKRRRRSTARKTIKRVRRRSPVVKRRRAPAKRSLQSKIPLVNNPTIRKVATGIGLATIGVAVISMVAPSIAQNPIVKPALAFLGGGIPGVIGQVVVGGGIPQISNILGGGSQQTNSAGSGGFA